MEKQYRCHYAYYRNWIIANYYMVFLKFEDINISTVLEESVT
jgi:hypothetical protein